MCIRDRYNNFLDEFCEDMRGCLSIAKEAGIADDQIILDPGVGFGKNYEHNLTIIHHLERLCDMGYPCLLYTSGSLFLRSLLPFLPPTSRTEMQREPLRSTMCLGVQEIIGTQGKAESEASSWVEMVSARMRHLRPLQRLRRTDG